MWASVLRFILPFLAEFIISLVKNLQAARLDDKNLLEVAYIIVTGVSKDHPEWSNDQKYEYAFQAIKVELQRLGRDTRDSIINTILELAVQRMKVR